ncbi:hypothetical protein JW711_00640 [Candidatus Woesearchaeota archaeon]|nr:hypothetical protein [Candidatus Woesearchaeota archaeon]
MGLEERLDETEQEPIILVPSEIVYYGNMRFEEYDPAHTGLVFGFEMPYKDVKELLRSHFEKEVEHFKDLRKIMNSDETLPGIHRFLISLSQPKLMHHIYNQLIEPLLAGVGYYDPAKHKVRESFTELMTNAIIFASRAGYPEDYIKRGLTPPNPDEVKENRKKRIGLDFILTPKIQLGRTTDIGHGFNLDKVTKYALPPPDIMSMTPEEQAPYLKSYGRGLIIVNQRSGETVCVRKIEDGEACNCAVSYININRDD